MDSVELFKALSNKTRLQILQWLKEPVVHFGVQEHGDFEEVGVCVGLIRQKCGLSQSTVSEYLTVLQRAGLLQATRLGQWTYYRRNEQAFTELSRLIGEEI